MLDMVDHGFTRLYGKNIQSSSNDEEISPIDYQVNGDYSDDYGCDYECISSNEKTSFKQPKNAKQEGKKPTRNKRKSTEDSKTTSNNDSSRNSHNKDVRIEKSRVVIRETLNVNDPIEAANSSIWSTLRVKNDGNHRARTPTGKSGLFGGVQVPQYNGGANHEQRNSPSVEASSMIREFNPAAFSRSLSFHEMAR